MVAQAASDDPQPSLLYEALQRPEPNDPKDSRLPASPGERRDRKPNIQFSD